MSPTERGDLLRLFVGLRAQLLASIGEDVLRLAGCLGRDGSRLLGGRRRDGGCLVLGGRGDVAGLVRGRCRGVGGLLRAGHCGGTGGGCGDVCHGRSLDP